MAQRPFLLNLGPRMLKPQNQIDIKDPNFVGEAIAFIKTSFMCSKKTHKNVSTVSNNSTLERSLVATISR